VFPSCAGRPVQVVRAAADLRFTVEDAAAVPRAQLDARLLARAAEPFDLGEGPLLRVGLFSRGPHDHVLLITVHHIIGDLWSLIVLLDELRVAYPAARLGEAAALPPAPPPYAEYVRWQHELLGGPEGDRLWAYWREQLERDLPTLDLAVDRP